MTNDRSPDERDAPSRPRFGLCYARFGAPNPQGFTSVTAYLTDPSQDGVKIDWDPAAGPDPFEAAGLVVSHRAVAGPDGRLDTSVSEATAPGAPSMWFVRVGQRAADQRHLVSLVAFADDRLSDGRVIDESTFALLGVDNATQIAAVEWSKDDGTVTQLYVAKEHRRSMVALKLLCTAGTVHHARRWPGAIRANGRRTAMGQDFVSNIPFAVRIAPHTELSPPMDPDGA